MRKKARAAGCDGYVTKPYSPKQLVDLVREFLAKAWMTSRHPGTCEGKKNQAATLSA